MGRHKVTTQLGLQIWLDGLQICENRSNGPELGPWDPIRGLLIEFVVLEGPILMDVIGLMNLGSNWGAAK